MRDAYQRANLTLHPSLSLQERTVAAMNARRRPKARRRWPVYLSAVAAVLAVVILISLMPRPTGGATGRVASLRSYALREPRYPAYPSRINNLGIEREGFFEEFWDYREKNIRDVDEDFAALVAQFSAASSRLVLTGQEDNGIYSPVTLWIALAMLAETTGGESRRQILDALGVDSLETLREQTNALWTRLYCADGTVATLPASSVWLNRGQKYNQNTLDTLADYYFAGSYAVDMGTEKANKAIASWLDGQTGGLLKDSTGNIQTDPLDVMRLYATLYYYGEWSYPFNKAKNTEDIFTCTDGKKVTAEFMHKRTESNVIFGESFTMAPLFTKNTGVYFILPDEGKSVDEVLADQGLWDSLAYRSEAESYETGYYKIDWSLPKFDAACDLSLTDAMEQMGMTNVFLPETADFSPLSDTNLPVALSGAHQAARIQVDEEGIKGVSYVELPAAGAAPPPDEIVVMDLNRPFLLVITSPVQGVPLFVGVINDPTVS